MLVIGDILEQKLFSTLDSVYLADQITPHPNLHPMISADVEIFLHSNIDIHKAERFTHY